MGSGSGLFAASWGVPWTANGFANGHGVVRPVMLSRFVGGGLSGTAVEEPESNGFGCFGEHAIWREVCAVECLVGDADLCDQTGVPE